MATTASGRYTSIDTRFAQLCGALEDGWHIEPPVYLRYQWFGQNEQGYYFILKRNSEVDLIVISDCESIRAWVRTQRLRVIAS